MSAQKKMIAVVRASLRSITHPRFFETERGFQGELLVELRRRIKLRAQAIVEQEYQKTAGHHGLVIRPDLIVHVPFDPERHEDRTHDNFAVFELKRRARKKAAAADIESLAQMLNVLRYPLGFFINIDSKNTFRNVVPEDLKAQIVNFAVFLHDGKAVVVEDQ